MTPRSWTLLLLAGGACVDVDVGSETDEVAGGTLVPPGQFESVVSLENFVGRFCSGTLISDSIVLTAGHCACNELDPDCSERISIAFKDVRPVENPSIRTDRFIPGTVIVHPDFAPPVPPALASTNDIGVILLDTPASEVVLVSPTPIANTLPALGSTVTLVGFGLSEAPSGECDSDNDLKRRASTQVDEIGPGAVGTGDLVIRLIDPVVHACQGDSGGALLDAQGRLVGVMTASDSESSTVSRAVPAFLEWIGLQGTSPGGRVGAWDLSGSPPAAPLYADSKPDPLGLIGWIDDADLRMTGDFLNRGHDQVLYVNTGGSGGYVRIADYEDGVGPTESAYWLNYGQPTQFTSYLQSNDVKLVGNFFGRGYDQLLLINNSGSGGRVMIVDFAVNPLTPTFTPFEAYGQSTILNGWHDPGDGVLVGDFFGNAFDQVLFVNRTSTSGRILIADFRDGATPIVVRYHETYSQGTQLGGWHDANDLMFAGDFRDLFRDQVLFINRGAGTGRVLVADFSDGQFPAESRLFLTPNQATALNGFIDSEDLALAGIFRGDRHQVAFIDRTFGVINFNRVKIIDFSGAALSVPFSEPVPGAGLLQRAIDATDRVLAGDVRGSGNDQLVTLEVLEQ